MKTKIKHNLISILKNNPIFIIKILEYHSRDKKLPLVIDKILIKNLLQDIFDKAISIYEVNSFLKELKSLYGLRFTADKKIKLNTFENKINSFKAIKTIKYNRQEAINI